jgi:hypothetical protein
VIAVGELESNLPVLDNQLRGIFRPPSRHPVVAGRHEKLDSIGVSILRGGDLG